MRVTEDTTHITGVWQEMLDAWKAPIVARTHVGEFSGKLLDSKTMANLDAQGLGPERIKVGRKIGYPKLSLVLWMMSRSKQEGHPHAG